MTNPDLNLTTFVVTINGTQVSVDFADAIEQCLVESTLHMPSMAQIRIWDPKLTFIDHANTAVGKAIVITEQATSKEIFNGEIVEVECSFEGSNRCYTTIHALDKLHRLTIGRKTRSYVNKKDSDIVTAICSEAGLSAEVTATTVVHPFLFQANETDLEFLHRLAKNNGFVLSCNAGKVIFKEPTVSPAAATLKWGETLHSFHYRVNDQVVRKKTTVYGWDPKTKKEVVGTVSTASLKPNTSGEAVSTNFTLAAEEVAVSSAMRTQAMAQKLAQSLHNAQNGQRIEVEGTAIGNGSLMAGKAITIANAGTRCSGTYLLTRVVHRFVARQTYEIEFTAGAYESSTLLSAIEPEAAAAPSLGLVPAVVTNINPAAADNDSHVGRVKIKYPWLSSTLEGGWARVASPGAGPNRGLQFIPAVNDEVVVGFFMNDINQPFIVGGLWNGKDALAEPAYQTNGLVNIWKIRTRSGHMITLDDTSGQEKITVIDKSQNSIVINSVDNSITVTSKGDMTFKSSKNITIDAAMNITMKANQKINATGTTGITMNASAGDFSATGGMNATVKANLNATLDGMAGATVKSVAKVDVNGTAMVNIKGALVNLN